MTTLLRQKYGAPPLLNASHRKTLLETTCRTPDGAPGRKPLGGVTPRYDAKLIGQRTFDAAVPRFKTSES